MDNLVLKTIMERRSIRAYKDEMLSTEQLNALKAAALISPTAMNKQEWHFSFIENKEIILEMESYIATEILKNADEAMRERMASRNNKVTYDAPLLVIISADSTAAYGKLDAGIAAQSLAIAAKSMGLDSVILGMAGLAFGGEKGDYWKEKIKIPEGYDFAIGIAIGYANMNGNKRETDQRKLSVIK